MSGIGPTGIPRPSSAIVALPSALMRTVISRAKPLTASSIELSTTS
jgi:hypothetical protein